MALRDLFGKGRKKDGTGSDTEQDRGQEAAAYGFPAADEAGRSCSIPNRRARPTTNPTERLRSGAEQARPLIEQAAPVAVPAASDEAGRISSAPTVRRRPTNPTERVRDGGMRLQPEVAQAAPIPAPVQDDAGRIASAPARRRATNPMERVRPAEVQTPAMMTDDAGSMPSSPHIRNRSAANSAPQESSGQTSADRLASAPAVRRPRQVPSAGPAGPVPPPVHTVPLKKQPSSTNPAVRVQPAEMPELTKPAVRPAAPVAPAEPVMPAIPVPANPKEEEVNPFAGL